jgi:dipeptidyl aminopeptidase/acylaminoacyl peptidase
MNKPARPFLALLVLAIAILACDVPIPQIPFPGTPAPGGGTVLPPASPNPNDVGTAVAATLTASAPGSGESDTTVTPTTVLPTISATEPGGSTFSLPQTLYYLAPDPAGLTQVFRLETDGTTQRQVTSESESVSDYDVSPVDGSVAYMVDNQLLYINADESERRLLVDGGTVDPNNPFISTVSSPVFSLDGQTLAYGYKGLQIYSFSVDESELVIENQVDDVGGGLFVPRELYTPERYSPDGTKLLITLGYYEGASSAIYYPATNALVRLEGGEGALICCDDVEWSSDSASLYSASASAGMFSPGLWKVDAATGEVTNLIPGDAGGGNYNAAKEAYLAPDGQLYFFFGTVASPDGVFNRAPLQLVRSAPDGVTGRTVLSTEDFQLLNEALWAPDASFVAVAMAPAPEVFQGGQAKIVYPDGRPGVPLVPFAQQMKWGP